MKLSSRHRTGNLKKMAKKGKTALVLIQPQTLLYKHSIPNGTTLADHKHSFENLVSAAKERGAYVVYAGSSTKLWWRLIELSDAVFVLEEQELFWKKEPKKLKKDDGERKLTKNEKEHLKEKKATFLEDTPESYAKAAEELAKKFEKLKVTGILVCGGYENDCIRHFLLNMHRKMRDLEVLLPPKFIVRGCGTTFREAMEKEGLRIKPAAGEKTELLNLL